MSNVLSLKISESFKYYRNAERLVSAPRLAFFFFVQEGGSGISGRREKQ